MKRALKRTIACAAPARPANGVRVLLYHAIDEPDPVDRLALCVSKDAFLEQLTFLRDQAYDVVPLTALLDAAHSHGRPRVAITFDDGYRSQAWAAGALKEFGFPATFFVVPRFLDGVRFPQALWERWEHLSWDEADALAASGFEIGAHSATHPDLRLCTDAQLEGEVIGAKALIETRLNREVVSFSYPFGRYDRRVRRAVSAAGYRAACTSRYGANYPGGPLLTIRRIEVTGSDDPADFQRKLAGKYDWMGLWQGLRSPS